MIEIKKITKLAIFDLDGTLLDTPLPEFGKQLYKEKTGEDWPFEGWWGRPLSLDMSIFDIPTIPQVIEDYQKEKECDKTLTVMLTGRMVKFGDLVKDILKSKGLTFDEYHFNRGGSTDVAKIKTIEKLLEKYTSVKEVEMWDDNKKYLEHYQRFGDGLIKTGQLTTFKTNIVPAYRH